VDDEGELEGEGGDDERVFGSGRRQKVFHCVQNGAVDRAHLVAKRHTRTKWVSARKDKKKRKGMWNFANFRHAAR
jgi:hypothetical protein